VTVVPPPDVVTFGETMGVFWSPMVGPLRHASVMHVGVAGAESNLATGLTRLGHRVAWTGRVGDDEFGRRVLVALRGEGVDVAAATVDPVAQTGLMVKSQRMSGSAEVIYYRRGSAASRLGPEHLDEALIAGAGVLHITGISAAISDSARAAVFAACEIAVAGGTTISFDPNYRSALWAADEAAAVCRELAARADLLLLSEDEARLIDGDGRRAPVPQLATRLRELGPSQVVIKRGVDGALLATDEGALEVAVYRVDAVDHVGAGDAFDAGYIAGVLEGLPLAARADLAARVGAFAVTVHGDWEGLPRRQELGLLDGRHEVAR
jgi:2-dehydro-3-deoxygluconokinase